MSKLYDEIRSYLSRYPKGAYVDRSGLLSHVMNNVESTGHYTVTRVRNGQKQTTSGGDKRTLLTRKYLLLLERIGAIVRVDTKQVYIADVAKLENADKLITKWFGDRKEKVEP